jgi:tRNA modification GTPase
MYIGRKDTIAAIGTRPGEAAIGIVKISGERSVEIAGKIFRSAGDRKISNIGTYEMVYGKIIEEDGSVIDEVLVSVMKKPKSYTREDVVEINCHGGVVATSKVLKLCLEKGARLAQPGEFTKRAFLNGRIDLSQAEAVAELVKSKTEQSLKIAARNLNGEIKEETKKLRKRILDILVQLEASVDFIEEDLEITPYQKLRAGVSAILEKIKELIKDEKRGEIVKNGVKIAIVGRTNVGKSSLLNVLSKKEKAIVTSIPGTTRDAVEEVLYVEGIPLILVDTAGIRKTKNTIEKLGVERSLRHINEAEVIIFVVDGSKKIREMDIEIAETIKGRKVIVCVNKIDLKQKIEKTKINNYIAKNNIIEISVLKGAGIEKLEDKIKEMVMSEKGFNIEEKIIINIRHKGVMKKVAELLHSAENAMEEKMSEEFPSADLKIAYDLLGEVIGETTREDVLDKIFNQFCIGK